MTGSADVDGHQKASGWGGRDHEAGERGQPRVQRRLRIWSKALGAGAVFKAKEPRASILRAFTRLSWAASNFAPAVLARRGVLDEPSAPPDAVHRRATWYGDTAAIAAHG